MMYADPWFDKQRRTVSEFVLLLGSSVNSELVTELVSKCSVADRYVHGSCTYWHDPIYCNTEKCWGKDTALTDNWSSHEWLREMTVDAYRDFEPRCKSCIRWLRNGGAPVEWRAFHNAAWSTESDADFITGCAVAQHCCKGDQPFQWEAAKFAPPYISNPLIFQHQIWHS